MIKRIVLILLMFCFVGLGMFSIKKYFDIERDKSEEQEIHQELIDISNVPEEPEKIENEFKINFEELLSINPNIVGWIQIEGTNINYPIVQGKDNTYYLKHNIYNKYASAGAIYMDATANKDFSSLNTFIYGHYTPTGVMFGELGKYMNQSFYEKHKNIYIYTPNKNYLLEVFSVHVDNASSPSYQMNFATDEAYKDYLQLMIEKSVIKTDIEIDYTKDKIVTLYSCSREANYKRQDRYYVHGRLIEFS